VINRRFNDRASCPARHSLKQTLERKPPIRTPATGNGRHVPTVSSGEDVFGVGGPDKRFWVLIVVVEVAVDRGLEVDQRAKDAAFETAARERRKSRRPH